MIVKLNKKDQELLDKRAMKYKGLKIGLITLSEALATAETDMWAEVYKHTSKDELVRLEHSTRKIKIHIKE